MSDLRELDLNAELTRVTLDRLKVSCAIMFGANLAESLTLEMIPMYADALSKNLCYRLNAFVYHREVRREESEWVQYPKRWWDSLKLEFAPKWFIRKWPVVYERKAVLVKHYHVCPHLPIASMERHIHFLAQNFS